MGDRLAEMDVLLRDIQVQLRPDREPAPALVDEAPVRDPAPTAPTPPAPDALDAPSERPEPASDPTRTDLSDLSAHLVASMRELLAGYERMLVGRSSPRPARRAVRHRPAESPDVTLSAAPFPNLDALHAFEQAVSRLPGVREVAVQGYEGTDRAIIAVRLDQRSP